MVVATARIVLAIPGCRSLKEKRRYVKGLVEKVRSRFGVACAEVGSQDRWGQAVLGVACVSTSSSHATRVLQAVVSLMDRADPLVLVDFSIEIL